MKCDNCRYRGFLGAEKHEDSHGYLTTVMYSGIRCTNSDCIFFRSPCKPLMDAGLDNCRGFEEVKEQSHDKRELNRRMNNADG